MRQPSSLITEVEAGHGIAVVTTITKLVAGKRLLYRPLAGTTEGAVRRHRPRYKG